MNGFSTTAPSRCKRSFWSARADRALMALSLPALSPPALCLIALSLMALSLMALPGRAMAKTIQVGPGRLVTTPGQAALLVRDGDTVVFDPGTYTGCAIWRASRLTIEAPRPGAVVTGPVCLDRALFVFLGNDIMIRGLSFEHARALGHTGAGILMEGANLLVEDSRFIDNENGILAGGPPHSIVRVRHSWFQSNGSCEGPCAHGLYIGTKIARLEVVGCVFLDTKIGHHIKSKAAATILWDNRIEDGRTGTASYLVDLPNGGDTEIMNNIFHKGARSDNKEAAISIGAEGGWQSTHVLRIRGNRFSSDLPEPVRFVRNGMNVPAVLKGNMLHGHVIALDGPGTVE